MFWKFSENKSIISPHTIILRTAYSLGQLILLNLLNVCDFKTSTNFTKIMSKKYVRDVQFHFTNQNIPKAEMKGIRF